MALNQNNNKVITFNNYVFLSNVEKVTGFKLFTKGESTEVFRGKLIAASIALEQKLNQGEFIYFRGEFNEKNELEQMFPLTECNDISIKGLPFVMVPSDKILFVLLESKSGIIIPSIPVSGPVKVQ